MTKNVAKCECLSARNRVILQILAIKPLKIIQLFSAKIPVSGARHSNVIVFDFTAGFARAPEDCDRSAGSQ
jgi:hypothetical protein